jgi:hypothetical protein
VRGAFLDIADNQVTAPAGTGARTCRRCVRPARPARTCCARGGATGGRNTEPELHHRLRTRTQDRIQATRWTGLRNLPLHTTAHNRVWLETVQLALDLLAWTPMLTLGSGFR